ncbi:MAG TPA: CDP-alcohol phosphatidyltransferase family protein, partial [Vicinamibacterales bacterium]|nr:CDP-alcohol phosphatidyltransferase family protein [Vicinamibacterales bacterium]
MLRPLRRRRTDVEARRFRRGVYLLPSMFTIGNMFCGYACIVYAMRGEFATAAPFIGFAMVLDMIDGRIARMTGATSDFGIQLDSLADVISFGLAPAILVFT